MLRGTENVMREMHKNPGPLKELFEIEADSLIV
jgi:hypothetical protein